MKRKNEYDSTKLTQVANNVAAMGVYVDSFPIEKVKLRFSEFKDAKNFIDIYLSFEDTLRITQDIKSGKLFKDIKNSEKPLTVSFGGSVKDGKVESRVISFGIKDDKIYINAQKGPGKTTSTGAIMPEGYPEKKVSIGLSIDSFKGVFLYTEVGINAYMTYFIRDLIKNAEEYRNKRSN